MAPQIVAINHHLVTWALPFAQRYIYTVHVEKYNQLKLSRFEKLQGLKIVVVETLLYRNAIKKCGASSKKRSECSCLLQDTMPVHHTRIRYLLYFHGAVLFVL